MENRDDFDNKSKNIKNRKTLKPLREHTCNLKEKNGITMDNASTNSNTAPAIFIASAAFSIIIPPYKLIILLLL